jgi:hypothetical protein
MAKLNDITIGVSLEYIEVISLQAKLELIKVKSAAMHATNSARVNLGASLAYGETDFMNLTESLEHVMGRIDKVAGAVKARLDQVSKAEETDPQTESESRIIPPDSSSVGMPIGIKRFDASEISPENFEGFRDYVCIKLDVGKIVKAVHMNLEEGFFVKHDDVITEGNSGDWLVFYNGRFWKVVDKRIFPERFKERVSTQPCKADQA